MERPFSEAMLKSIESQIEHCHENSSILDVYQASERARRENLPDNVALEDIVNHFVRNVGARCTIKFLPEFAEKIVESKSRKTAQKRRPLTDGNAKLVSVGLIFKDLDREKCHGRRPQ